MTTTRARATPTTTPTTTLWTTRSDDHATDTDDGDDAGDTGDGSTTTGSHDGDSGVGVMRPTMTPPTPPTTGATTTRSDHWGRVSHVAAGSRGDGDRDRDGDRDGSTGARELCRPPTTGTLGTGIEESRERVRYPALGVETGIDRVFNTVDITRERACVVGRGRE